jgi:hypothetical protein
MVNRSNEPWPECLTESFARNRQFNSARPQFDHELRENAHKKRLITVSKSHEGSRARDLGKRIRT